ncbi:MAG: hydrogenase expression/formation protein HypE [Spirochaetia bacterium]|nr:hydrogenase expression/formation protein HypE [Spirochaetia bacterium]
MKKILLEHGTGADKSAKLINDIFLSHLGNETLNKLEDASAFRAPENLAVSTDNFTVKPIFFNGGDIGKLAVCGTCNDLAVMGAKPLYLSAGFIIEEGFLIDDLEKIVISMKNELAVNNATVITGDTKVVPKNAADGIYINTTGIGEIKMPGISASSIQEDDIIIVSGNVGDHGSVIFASREGIDIKSDLKSDCASLWPLVQQLIEADLKIHSMRDATRGGLSAVLNEWAEKSKTGLYIHEKDIPLSDETRGICELLGFEPYHLACEGAFIMAVKKEDAEKTLEICRASSLGKNASIIGYATNRHHEKVLLETPMGTVRIFETPSGLLLPRIC